jgi:hypothetical protein
MIIIEMISLRLMDKYLNKKIINELKKKFLLVYLKSAIAVDLPSFILPLCI